MRLESDRVLYPGEPRPGQIVALTNAFFSDLKQAQTAAKATMAELSADIPNYTNIQPESYFAELNVHSLTTAV